MGSTEEDIKKCIKNRDECLKLANMYMENANRYEDNIRYILLDIFPNISVNDIVLGEFYCGNSPTGKCVYIRNNSGEITECHFCKSCGVEF